jgi:hypothetical protein
MPVLDATSANHDLWRAYARANLAWLGPLAAPIGDALGAMAAQWYGAAFGGVIDALYAENAPEVSRFVEARRLVEDARHDDAEPEAVPATFRRRRLQPVEQHASASASF